MVGSGNGFKALVVYFTQLILVSPCHFGSSFGLGESLGPYTGRCLGRPFQGESFDVAIVTALPKEGKSSITSRRLGRRRARGRR
jgi:hypothetical protein